VCGCRGIGGGPKLGQAFVLLPKKAGESADAAAGYLATLRTVRIDGNRGQVNVVVCESDYRAHNFWNLRSRKLGLGWVTDFGTGAPLQTRC
jgi:hypothetical protein